MRENYAYLGEVTLSEFAEIHKGFPNVVGIDTATYDGKQYVVVGISKEFSDEIIDLHLLAISLYGDKASRESCLELIF